MSNELKPCPFCGGEASLLHFGCPIIQCRECGNRGFSANTDDKAIAAWNQRADGWISVEERLPDETDSFKVALDMGNGRRSVGDATYSGPACKFLGDPYGWITHWMPNPELPPK